MSNTLVDPVDLDDFPGAPYMDGPIDVAVASVRAEAGWHIAPVVTETITVDSYGSCRLFLPTLRLVSVTAVRDVTTGIPVVLTGWVREPGSVLYRQWWPLGVLEVDLTHGFDETPLELLPVIANRVRNMGNPRDPGLASRTTTRGPFTDSESYRDGAVATDPVVARYAVHLRVG